MNPSSNSVSSLIEVSAPRAGAFPATRWSLVLQARDEQKLKATEALAELCKAYWKPVYAFLRRKGNTPHDAEDLTQGFFAMLLERNSFATVEEGKGRLRSFLLVALKRFAANEHERSMALKRGGGVSHMALDANAAEECCAVDPGTNVTPELMFERQWAVGMLDTVLNKLRSEYAKDGREGVFDALKVRLSADGDGEGDTLALISERLGMNEGALKVAVYRMRQRYRRLLKDEITLTVDSPEQVNDEIMHLFRVFG
ncbi:RNA polymerase sigma factor [Prosthecobacter sp.]|jgi:DNA-directed RNA polymerase specialized sigma24 family protein|uniref:RNA polymerase sigma factor n=1 Tax=Prosthecobacter sp. TaxID=1965333 RepID=UPI003784420C